MADSQMEEYRRRMQARHQGHSPAPPPARPAVVQEASAPPSAPLSTALHLGDPRREAQRPLLGGPVTEAWLPKVTDTCCGVETQTLVLATAASMTALILFLCLLQLMN